MGEDIVSLKAVIDLHSEVGADPIPMLERVAMTIARRADSESAGRAASAGAKLSGAIVGGLPLVSLPLLPMAHAPLLDAAGLALLFFGLVLTCAGMLWMWRLVPAAGPGDDPLVLLADHVAAALAAGASLSTALDAATRRAPGTLASAGRRARLGQPWPEALMAVAPEGSQALVTALRRAERLGVPPARTLAEFADARRAAASRAFERTVRRAPVLMVLPLVLCVLPAFGLLAVLPFLRGITLG
jgi:Flp pilus assembly protein TadB